MHLQDAYNFYACKRYDHADDTAFNHLVIINMNTENGQSKSPCLIRTRLPLWLNLTNSNNTYLHSSRYIFLNKEYN